MKPVVKKIKITQHIHTDSLGILRAKIIRFFMLWTYDMDHIVSNLILFLLFQIPVTAWVIMNKNIIFTRSL